MDAFPRFGGDFTSQDTSHHFVWDCGAQVSNSSEGVEYQTLLSRYLQGCNSDSVNFGKGKVYRVVPSTLRSTFLSTIRVEVA